MAKVFIVTGGWDYEGTTVVAVHTNRRKAQAAFDLANTSRLGDYYYAYLNEWDTNTQEANTLDSKGR